MADHNSRITSVAIPRPSIGPYVANSQRRAPSAAGAGGGWLEIWSDSALMRFEDNADPHMCGSLYPIAVDVREKSYTELEIKIQISSASLLNTRLELYGENDTATKVIATVAPEQSFPALGLHPVRVMVSPPWARQDIPWGLAGNITWKLRNLETGSLMGLNSSRLEIYALTGTVPKFFRDRVPVELLRRVVLPRRTWTSSDTWERYCCLLVFQHFAFRYDVRGGVARYHVPKAGTFQLARYLHDIGSRGVVNCYDQAAAMQIFLALSPTTPEVHWMFMEPFGFIRTTVLVGRGACNNPMYERNGTAPVLGRTSPDRRCFGNHAFVRVGPAAPDTKILDACCGPHTGHENLDRYIQNSIDPRCRNVGLNGRATDVAPVPDAVQRLLMA
ncbi:hypothetical protein EKO27_g6805 [Xylaria grammica]|uniref:Uncharacterized protein n=1 Tax=Xylaria grammica TaxID=363999 RepID=A0A439D1G6_9PEZI|nr:hypothetical protein EKO27_g6805 [Xylaria grammica]